jgi:DNA-binding transcriptional ArsR family regulator
MDDVFKALADASRRKLLDELRAHNGRTLSQLAAQLDMTRQAASKHIAILEAANLVVPIWRGREKLHYLNPVPIHEISNRWIKRFDHAPLASLAKLKAQLERPEE